MPQLSYFYGISIEMYYFDHSPPHFHAKYAEHDAQIQLTNGVIMHGHLPRRARKLVEEWRLLHEAELASAWEASRGIGRFDKIAPLP